MAPPLTRRRTTTIIAAVALAVAVAGCNGEGDEVDTGAVTHTVTLDDNSTDSDIATAPAPGDGTASTAAPDVEAETDGPDTAETTAAPTGPAQERVWSRHPSEDSFSVLLPDGWLNVTAEVADDGAALATRPATPSSGVFTNVVIAPADPVDDLEESLERSIADLEAEEEIEARAVDPVEIDGVEAIGFTLIDEEADPPTAQTRWFFEYEDHLYIAVVTSHVREQESAEDAFATIVDSWRWGPAD